MSRMWKTVSELRSAHYLKNMVVKFIFEFLFREWLENGSSLCARCGERFVAVGCMGEHDRDRHGCNGVG